MLSTDERFETGAPAYAAYLQSVEGRLRLDIAWDNFLSLIDETQRAQTKLAAQPARGEQSERQALDLGGGTGAIGLRFAALGWRVTVVDPSATMLALAADAARIAGFAERVTFHQSVAERAHEHLKPQTFDAGVCHNVLEYVSDPRACVRVLATLIKPGGLVSLVARNRAGEAMRAALKAHDLNEAEHALAADVVKESLYGGPARLFDASTLRELATGAGLHVVAERGVRVVADYLPASLSDTPDAYGRLLAFERTLGARPEFASVARYTQIIARLPDAATVTGHGSS